MLATRKTKIRLREEQEAFRHEYYELLEVMKVIMEERGKVRDVSTPIYYRRSAHDCLGMAKHKALRIESLLSKLDLEDPQPKCLDDIVEECVDASNYLLFIAALCQLIRGEEE